MKIFVITLSYWLATALFLLVAPDTSTWNGLVGSANIQAAIVQTSTKAAVQTVNETEFKERLISQGFDPKGSSPEEFSAFIQAESVRWATILKTMKVKIE
jgi:tripartite-type tricarboxylate transporter receptor subunit TctC